MKRKEEKPGLKVTKDGKVFIRGVKTYVNGDKYEGEFVEAMRHGQGRMRFINGDTYEGDFERNYFHGIGTYTWAGFLDGDNNMVHGKKYVGDWYDGKKTGRGIYILGTGETYSGCFQNDLYEGTGALKKANGDVFEGEWCRGRPSGKMKVKFANGDLYEGDMIGGHYEGRGKIIYADEMGMFEGQWHNGKFHGKGVRVYCNGSKFVGEFLDGEIEGEGMMFYSNGDQYLGFWRRGLFEGKGVYRYANGESYEGAFMQGVRYGEGKFRYKDQSYYHGEYRNVQSAATASSLHLPLCDGKRHGTGIRVWSTGAKYEGQWMEDKMHGPGLLTTVEGGKYEGQFFNGLRGGKGVEQFGNLVGIAFVCPLGNKHGGVGFCTYKGDYHQGLFHGQGELCCMNGQRYVGQFCRGHRHGRGEFFFLRDGEMGNEARLCIGGLGSLYRFKSYKGEYTHGERTGVGIATYTNGDTLEGHFEKGQPHGTIVCTFRDSGRVRIARFVRGQRVEWVEVHKRHVKPGLFRSQSNTSSNMLVKTSSPKGDARSVSPAKR